MKPRTLPPARTIAEAIRRMLGLPYRVDPDESHYLLRDGILRACEARPDVPELVQLADLVDAHDALPLRGTAFFNAKRAQRAQRQAPPTAPQPARRTA